MAVLIRISLLHFRGLLDRHTFIRSRQIGAHVFHILQEGLR